MTDYTFYTLDDCCHVYRSTDIGANWTESVTPQLHADWADLVMAINDSDFTTIMATCQTNLGNINYAISTTNAETNTWTSYNPKAGHKYVSGAITANAAIILLTPDVTSGSGDATAFPTISYDSGATFTDIQPLGSSNHTFGGRVAFSQGGAIMYMTRAHATSHIIWKSTDQGANWTELTGSPVAQTGIATDEQQMRLRCSQNGQIVVYCDTAGHGGDNTLPNLWVSVNAGVTWTETLLPGPIGRLTNVDLSMSLDGSTILYINDWSVSPDALCTAALSKNSGSTWTDISLRLPSNSISGTESDLNSCAVSQDGEAMFVVYDIDHTTHSFVDVSTNGGVTWTQREFTGHSFDLASPEPLGVYTGAYAIGGSSSGGGGVTPSGTPVPARLLGATYRRTSAMTSESPSIIGWHRHDLGHARIVWSIGVAPNPGGLLDALDMVTQEGSTYYVEGLTQIFDEDDTLTDAWFVDGGLVPDSAYEHTYSGTTGIVFTGLWYLADKRVTVWCLGLDLGDYTVDPTNGTVFVPYGSGTAPTTFDYSTVGQGAYLFTAAYITANLSATDVRNGGVPYSGKFMPCCVGFPFTSDGQTLRPATPDQVGTRAGPGMGQRRRTHSVNGLLHNTLGISFGTDFGATLQTARLKDEAGTEPTPTEPFSGVITETLNDDYTYDGMVSWRITRPYPASVVSIGGSVVGTDS